MKKFYIHTMGCQMNVNDTEKMSGLLGVEGYCPTGELREADLIILNTCSVRQKAEQKFFSELGTLKNLKKTRPEVRIAVAGCIAQQQGKKIFTRAPHADYVFGPQNMHRLPDLLNGPSHVVANEDNPDLAETDLPVRRNQGGRAWVTIMYGCNNFCTYCIVPFTRGREKSRPSENIVREIAGLAENGFREITLLGQNVNSYNSDIDFPGLLTKVNFIEAIERIRFVTSHPKDLSLNLISAVRELDKVCEHIHLPLQSGSDRILLEMNRGYTYGDYCKSVASLRKAMPDISITTDIITGFPGETEADHAQTITALNGIRFDGVYAFKYSPRPGTRAAEKEAQISRETASRRLAEILEACDDISLKLNNELINTVQEILVEGISGTVGDMLLTGRTRSGKIVNFKGAMPLIGKIVPVRIAVAMKNSLKGSLV